MNKNSKRNEAGVKDATIKCAECGSENVTTSDEQYNFPYYVGDDSVELTACVPIRICTDCGFRYLDKTAEQFCHDAICEHLGVMKPIQIKALRDYFRLTQAEFSKITKIGEATLSRWERGIVIQNEAYNNYLYLLGLEGNLQKIRERGKSTEPMVSNVERPKQPKFRELDVNEEVLQRKGNFKLRRV